jgi:hypothetical protein
MASAIFPLKLASNLEKSSESYSSGGIEIITQLEDNRITQSRDISRGISQYISVEKIKSLAETKFEQTGEGLTWKDLVNDGPFKCAENKQSAQDKLYYHYGEETLQNFAILQISAKHQIA